MSEFVVPWADVQRYLRDRREGVILDLSGAEDLQNLYRAQGKLALLDELLNLKDILATLTSVDKSTKPV